MNGVNERFIRNTSGEAAPPFGLAEIVGASPQTEDLGQGVQSTDSVIDIRKPTGSGQLIAIGPAGIPDGRIGQGFTGSPFVRYTGDPDGPLKVTPGSWELTDTGTGDEVTILGDARSKGAAPNNYQIVRVDLAPSQNTPPEQNHGVATLAAPLAATGGSAIRDYRASEGGLSPIASGQTFAAIDNPHELTGSLGDEVDVRLSGADWIVVAVRSAQRHGVATLTGELLASQGAPGTPPVAIQGYRPEVGPADPAPAEASNPHGLDAAAGSEIDVSLVGDAWQIVAVRSRGGGAEPIDLTNAYIEFNTNGTFSARIRAGSFTSQWFVVPVVTCDSGAIEGSPPT